MAKVDYNQDQQTNLGHSEYQLLHGDGLRIMRQGMGDCPRFMIIYSTNLPCMRPRYGPGHLVPNRADRCLEIIGAARRTLRNDVPMHFFISSLIKREQEVPATETRDSFNGREIISEIIISSGYTHEEPQATELF
jgi:hypothetical protein